MKITKREILASIAIIALLLFFGFLISGKISDALMESYQEYDTALRIDGDAEQFVYGMRTSVGPAFVYGALRAEDPVTFDEIGGSYSSVKKVEERYTRHTREVDDYDSDGKKIGSHTEVYYTWDYIAEWQKHCSTISFLEQRFPFGRISFPSESYIKTRKVSSDTRYKYYGSPESSTGTLYAKLSDSTIKDTHFHPNRTIDETISDLESGWELILFWIAWILLIGGCVFGFYYIDNRWLED
jgi:hypothetical protein